MSRTIFVGNVPPAMKKKALAKLFSTKCAPERECVMFGCLRSRHKDGFAKKQAVYAMGCITG